MTDSTQFRILYVGRKAQFTDDLQKLFERQNRRADDPSLPLLIAPQKSGREQRDGTSVSSEATVAWPAVDLICVTNQKAALHIVRTQPPSAVIVELEQKTESRLRFCEKLHYRLPTAVILALATKLPKSSFTFDGFIQLPLQERAIVRLIGKLSMDRSQYALQHGPIRLDLTTRTVNTPSGQYTMTPKQCALLKLFMAEHGQIVERRKIMEHVWETTYIEDTRTLDVHIRWLRERIEQNPSKPVYLKTIRGVGYRFSVNGHGD